jgi:PGF-pre-PGF domain-containing protein
MGKESIKYIAPLVLALLLLGMMAANAGTSTNTVGNVIATVTSNTSMVNSSVNMNFTIRDTFNSTSWYNITFPTGFNANGAIVTVTINGSTNPVNWTNANGTLFVNVSSNDQTNFSANTSTQYINLSNITTPSSQNLSAIITITTNNTVVIPLNYSVLKSVNLGTAGNFSILAGSAVTGAAGNVITGDVGLYPTTGAAITALTCAEVTGAIYDYNGAYTGGGGGTTACLLTNATKLALAQNDLGTAINDSVGRTSVTIGNTLDTLTLTPGVYNGGALALGAGTTLTLDAQGDSNAVFIIKAASTLNTGAGSNVNLINGAQASNVFWQVGSSADLATGSFFNGTILANTTITLVGSANVMGSLLARDGAVTLGAGSVVTNPFVVSSVIPVKFVTSVPMRMLNATGAATKIPTSVYYYYNGSTIRINVSLNQTNLNVSADFSQVANHSFINTSWSYDNGSGEYIYNLTAIAGNVPMGGYPITITATNTTTFATNVSTIPPIAVMNVNPQAMDTTLGGTNWTTDIADFTNATLTFTKFTDPTHNNKLGTLEFLDPMNLADNTTATALQNLGNNMNMSATSMTLNSATSALAAMNVSSSLSAYNLSFNTSPAIFSDGVLIALPDNSTGGNASNINWDQTNHTLTLNVSHWTSYSWGTYGVNLTNITPVSITTAAATNATYTFTLLNNGTQADTYNLTISNPNTASVADVNRSSVFLTSGASTVIALNVTNGANGIFYVNVTATSLNYSNRTASINTTTNVTGATNGTSLTSTSGLTQTAFVNSNATYTFSLKNNGSQTDNYTINVSNPDNAVIANLSIASTQMITSGTTLIFTLNVSNASAGTFRVNITANSTNDPNKLGYINTTTIVIASVPTSVDLGTAGDFVILAKTGISTTGTTSIVGDIGVSPAAATYITGFGLIMDTSNKFSTSSKVTGKVYAADYTPPTPSKMTTAVSNMQTAYTNASGRAPNVTELGAGTLNGITLAPGVYYWSSPVTITGDIYLNGSSTDVWIFQIAQTLDISTSKQVHLSGGALPENIFWQVAGTTTLGTYSTVNGNILDQTLIALNTGATLNGRALAQTAVTLDANSVIAPSSSISNGTLKGAYIKSGTNIGISGATVNITNSTRGSVITTTDSSGAYSVSLYPAIYTINVSKTGYSNSSTTATVATNTVTTVTTISLSSNTVTVAANRTVGTASTGQNVSFNLTVVNTGDNATFNVATSVTNTSTNVTNVTNPSPLLLNTSTSTGHIEVMVNNSYFGGWPVTITISNSSQSKSASITLNAIMRDASASFTNISSTNDTTTIVTGATLVNATIENYANVSGNSTLISNATITGIGTSITDGAVIKGDYGDSNIDNSTVGNATVDSSDLTGSTVRNNASVTNSTLTGATVDNSTLTNVTVSSTSTITNVSSLSNITLGGVTVTGDRNYDYEGSISSGTGWANYQTINFTRIYATVRISQLVIEQSSGQDIGSSTNTSLNDTSLSTSMNFSMTVNLSSGMVINISETGISPDGAGFSSGTQLGNFLVIRSNDTNASNVTRHVLRLYFDVDPSTYSGGVAIYYYNTGTHAWVKLDTTASGTEGGRYFVEATPNHMSTFALLGTTSTGGGGGSTGGGSSTGGGGVVTGEDFANIAKSESYDEDLVADTPVTYTFKTPELGVYEIALTGKENENGITLRVEALKGTSKQVTVQAPGTVYKNINILTGTQRMKEALIKFRVENTWLSSNSLAGSDVKMLHWVGSQWTQLETAQTTKDDTYTYYEAKTTTLSPFAISGIKGGVLVPPTATPAGVASGTPFMPTGTGTPATSPTQKAPAFEFVLTVAILSAAYLFGRKRR